MGSFVVFVQIGRERCFRRPDGTVRVAFHLVQGGELKQVGQGKHAGFEQQVVAAAGIRRHEQHAKRRALGLLDGEPKAPRQRCRDLLAEAVMLVIGHIGDEFVRELLGGLGAHVHFEEKTGIALALRVRDVEAVRVQGQAPLGFLPRLFVGLGENHGAGDSGVAGAGAQPQSDAGGIGVQGGIEIGDGQFVAKGVFRERGAIFHVRLLIAQGFVEVGAFGPFQLGKHRPEMLGFEVPDGGRFGEGGAFGRSDGHPIAPEEAQRVQAAQDVREVFDTRQLVALPGQGAVDLLGGHQPIVRDGFEDEEIEGGEDEFHGGENLRFEGGLRRLG